MYIDIVTYPATSRVISLTNAVRFDKKPFLREILGAGALGVTSVHSSRLDRCLDVGNVARKIRTVAGIKADDEAYIAVSIIIILNLRQW